MVHWAHPSQHSNGIAIRLAAFAGLTNVTKRQTDIQTTLLRVWQSITSYRCDAA